MLRIFIVVVVELCWVLFGDRRGGGEVREWRGVVGWGGFWVSRGESAGSSTALRVSELGTVGSE